jgi:chromatin segregation and condensation protein Rec8/ScpA/Scc1 (kleisin family)
MGNADADDPLDEIESDEDEDDDDDEAELMAELERIKQERAAERSKKDEEEREEKVFDFFQVLACIIRIFKRNAKNICSKSENANFLLYLL